MSLPGDKTYEMKGQHRVTRHTASGTLDARDLVNLIDCSGGAVVLTLPRLNQMIGQIVTFENTAGTNNVTLVVPANEAVNYTQIEAAGINLNAVGDRLVLYCDGRSWHIIANDIS